MLIYEKDHWMVRGVGKNAEHTLYKRASLTIVNCVSQCTCKDEDNNKQKFKKGGGKGRRMPEKSAEERAKDRVASCCAMSFQEIPVTVCHFFNVVCSQQSCTILYHTLCYLLIRMEICR